uniref:DNA topoisomerase n=1 Tax=Panagrolaimus sp. ES5 TaxID=591445 RepID=A0AC34GRS9_9BILA
MKKALSDSENYYVSLQHGAGVKEIYLDRYGFKSLDEFLEWYNKPVTNNFGHVQGRALEVLMIAEKDTMAHEVVKNLSFNNNYKIDRIRASKTDPDKLVKGYQFTTNLFDKIANVWITSTFGHLNRQTFPRAVDEYVSEGILRSKVIDVPCDKKVYFGGYSETIGKGCDLVILLLDNDEEGEVICFEVIEYLKEYINMPPSGNFMDAFFRARFSSAPEIVTAIHRLERPDVRILLSMVAKHYLDLRSGVALSRCQKFIAQKYVPKYTLEFVIKVDGLNFVFSSGEYGKSEAELMCEKLKGIQEGEVTKVSTSAPIIKKSPPGLNYFEFMKFLSRYFKIDSSEAAKIAQKLYELGYISYPRTETSKFPIYLQFNVNQLCCNFSEMDSKDAFLYHFNAQSSLYSDKNDAKMLQIIQNMNVDVQKVLHKGVDKKDQSPMTPTQKRLRKDDKMDDREKLVYKFIVRRFFAAFLDDYQYCEEKTEFQIEYELIQLMEDHDIGTDGSIPGHIEAIEKRGFVEINNRTFELRPLPLGIQMTDGYQKCIPDLVDPKFRAKFIRTVCGIGTGENDFVEVYNKGLKGIDENYQQLSKNFYHYFGQHIDEFKECFEPIRYHPVYKADKDHRNENVYCVDSN